MKSAMQILLFLSTAFATIYDQEYCQYDQNELLFITNTNIQRAVPYAHDVGKYFMVFQEDGCHFAYYDSPVQAYEAGLANIVTSAQSFKNKTCVYEIEQHRQGETTKMTFVWYYPKNYKLLPLNANCLKSVSEAVGLPIKKLKF